uniref:Uncharacterized protein n=1 Tax=Rhizophora mucronata TaxID=61149 RepID=A0A2P2QA69_RHIMU
MPPSDQATHFPSGKRVKFPKCRIAKEWSSTLKFLC